MNICAQILAKRPPLSFSLSEDLVIQIIERVLNPLERSDEFGFFHGHLISCLYGGLLQNLRGVEIVLKFDGIPRFETASRSDYEKYCDEVSSRCDAIAVEQGLGLRWRHRYYATELDAVEGTFVEQAKKRRRANDAASQLKLRGRMHTLDSVIAPVCDSPSSTGSRTTILTPDSSPLESIAASTSSSFTSQNGYNTGVWTHDSSSLSSPIAPPVSSPWEPPRQPFSVLPNAASPSTLQSNHMDILGCELCPQVFKGEPRDQRTNLKRHKETCHDHNLKYKCQHPDCGKAYARSDYLKKHQSKWHPTEDQPTRKNLRRILKKPVNSKDWLPTIVSPKTKSE